MANTFAHIDHGEVELKLAEPHSMEVKEVIKKKGLMARLPFNNFNRVQLLRRGVRILEPLHRKQNRLDLIAQLMRKRAEEPLPLQFKICGPRRGDIALVSRSPG